MAGSIEIRNLRVKRGSFVLDVPALDVHPHEIFAILGSTGSGKTVLMEAVAGACSWERGEILLDQDYALFPHMTVRENIGYGLKVRKTDPAEIERRVDRLLTDFGIKAIADRYPGIISGGEAQRTALARALILEPDILLLDEPFSALDPATKRQMYGVIQDVHARFDCTIVFVTHDFAEARILADRVGIVLGGRLRTVRDADKLFDVEGLESDVLAFLDIDNATR